MLELLAGTVAIVCATEKITPHLASAIAHDGHQLGVEQTLIPKNEAYLRLTISTKALY